MKTLYANGDSFVFGMECLDHGNKEEHNKELAFPKHVAVALNCETYINNAYNGATNEFIFRNTIFDLLELEASGVDPADVFVLIGWTSLYRIEIDGQSWFDSIPGFKQNEAWLLTNPDAPVEYRDNKTLFLNPTAGHVTTANGTKYDTHDTLLPFCVNYLWTDRLQVPTFEAKVLALHEFLKSKGYKHVFVNTCNIVETPKFDSIPNYYQATTNCFHHWAARDFETEVRNHNHFSPIPHKEYGKKLVDFIVNTIL